jgi:glycerol-3-phosphate dehydrogenase (NAD(P)+)
MESAPAVVALAAKYKVEMPICAAVHEILLERIDIDQAIVALLSRPFKAEGV